MSDQSIAEILMIPCAEASGRIKPVLVTRQPNATLYTFKLTAQQMRELCRVERFGVHEQGVNRLFDEDHACDIAVAMGQPETVFAENPLGSLEGDWSVEGSTLVYDVGAYIVLDDGQHRRGALELLDAEQLDAWEFTLTVTQGLDYRTRLKLFMQQGLGKGLDSRLQLQMQSELGEWRTPAEARAYELCKELATDPRSPLKGMIILGEMEKRPYEGRHRPAGINAKGLHITFTSLMSRKSPLAQLPPEKQLEVIKNLIRAASNVWPNAWMSDRHVLTTARGINAVCKLVMSGRSFQAAVGNDFSYENLVRVLTYAAKFNWTTNGALNTTVAKIADRLDKSIGGGLAKQQAAEGGLRV